MSPRPSAIERVFEIDSLEGLHSQFDKIVSEPGHTFTVLEVDRCGKSRAASPSINVESKFRFGRYIERKAGIKIFRHPVTEPLHR